MKALGTINIGNLLKSSAWRYAGKEAIYDVDADRRLSYTELNERVNRLANGILGLGGQKGDFVSILLYNCLELAECYFAVSKSGTIAAPLVYRLSAREITGLINLSGSKTLIYDVKLKDKVIKQDLVNVRNFICVGGADEGALEYDSLLKDCSPGEPPVDVFEEDNVYLNYTSGTTGLPKAYLLNHYNNAAAATYQFDLFGLTSRDVVATAFPAYGRVGFAWIMICVSKGCKNVIMNFEPRKFMEVVQREKVTFSNLVPTMAQMILTHPERSKYDFSSLRGIVYAAAPLPRVILENTWNNLCPNVFEYYGLQETAIMVLIDPANKRLKPDSVGCPVPGVEMRIVDDRGNDVTRGEIGEIIMKGPAAMIGYYQQPDKTAETIKNGWFHSGDLGRLDEDNYLYIMGRKKDMIISGGQNIFAAEVEEALMAHPGVLDCAVIGLPDDFWGEKVTAVVVPREGLKLSEDEIVQHCRGSIAAFKTPKSVIFSDVVPRNPTGKILKFMLIEQYRQN